MLVLNTGLVLLDALDGLCALIRSEEPRVGWRVGEKEPEQRQTVKTKRSTDERETYQYAVEVSNVKVPVMIISLEASLALPWSAGYIEGAHHCQGSKPGVWIWRDPKLMNPEMIWATHIFSLVDFATRRKQTYQFRSSKLS